MSKAQTDIDFILSKRNANGADFWASADGKVYVGNPFSTIGSLLMLHELDVPANHEAVAGGLDLILKCCRPDGRIRVGPKSPMYPCYSAEAARVLCRFGHTEHEAVQRAFQYFLESTFDDGGWRCNFSRFGKGPETQKSNPGATLNVLDALRFDPHNLEGNPTVDAAVLTLLQHWVDRVPTGPCHWGIGKRFKQIEFPFLRYNLFYYVYVLSHFVVARDDERFQQALNELNSKVNLDGELQMESRHRLLSKLNFCSTKQPTATANRRYQEILDATA